MYFDIKSPQIYLFITIFLSVCHRPLFRVKTKWRECMQQQISGPFSLSLCPNKCIVYQVDSQSKDPACRLTAAEIWKAHNAHNTRGGVNL